MSGRFLTEYILDTTGVIIQRGPGHAPQEIPPQIAHPIAGQEPVLRLPLSPVLSLSTLEHNANHDPHLFLREALEKIASELLQLEDAHHVALLNPRVVGPLSSSREHWLYARDLWSRKLRKKSDLEALKAIRDAIKGLIAAYATISADQIVTAKEQIEAIDWYFEPAGIKALHFTARSHYKRGRTFEYTSSPDKARLEFKKVIITIQRMYLEADLADYPINLTTTSPIRKVIILDFDDINVEMECCI